ncbi:MAG TPA: UbiA family prenyltransferase [Pirellulaceae bacterium]|jgi:4-hydroxybenzoate polyprenyltransferase
MSSPLRPEFEPASESEAAAPRNRGGILPWLRLMRLPNVFTAIADVSMGYLFVRHAVDAPLLFGFLIVASAALYTAGIMFNDLFDFQIDLRERPYRPLPSGRVSFYWAILVAGKLLSLGLFLGCISGLLREAPDAMPWRGALITAALTGCILAYDSFAKSTPVGPLVMGSCRFFNILMGMTAGEPRADGILLGFGPGELLAAAGIGVYIAGVTWFSRSETGMSKSAALFASLAVMLAGVAVLGSSLLYVPTRGGPHIYWLLLALLMFGVARRGTVAALDPVPEKVQSAVKLSILSLIWLDATMAVAVSGPSAGVAIAALLIPALILGRWVYST